MKCGREGDGTGVNVKISVEVEECDEEGDREAPSALGVPKASEGLEVKDGDTVKARDNVKPRDGVSSCEKNELGV